MFFCSPVDTVLCYNHYFGHIEAHIECQGKTLMHYGSSLPQINILHEVTRICTTCIVICIAMLWHLWRERSKESFTEVQMLILLLWVLFSEYANNLCNDWHWRSLINISQFLCASFGKEIYQHFISAHSRVQMKGVSCSSNLSGKGVMFNSVSLSIIHRCSTSCPQRSDIN